MARVGAKNFRHPEPKDGLDSSEGFEAKSPRLLRVGDPSLLGVSDLEVGED